MEAVQPDPAWVAAQRQAMRIHVSLLLLALFCMFAIFAWQTFASHSCHCQY